MSNKYIGQREVMVDGYEKVTGSTIFGADFTLQGSLYGKILRSSIPHGYIRSLNIKKAQSLPGVIKILTGKDLNFPYYSVAGQKAYDEQLLAKDKVHYIGDEIAAIAAVDEETALEALSLIEIEYEELPIISDPEEALKANAPKVHEFLDSNIATHMEFERGDVEKAFMKADVIVEDEFSTHMVHQAYLEPQSAVAKWDYSGNITIWASTQSPRLATLTYAKALGVSPRKIRVIQCNIGGAFGGKLECKIHPIAALLSKYTGKPVKIVNSRKEEFTATYPRMPIKSRIKLGALKDGTLLAKDSYFLGDNGAYNNYGFGIFLSAITRHDNLYRIENIRTKGDLVYTNKPATGCFRGFGNPQSHFAFESILDILAHKISVDPVELRLKNATKTGDITPHGWKIGSCGLSDCVEQAAKKAEWEKKKKDSYKGDVVKGIGLACCLHVSGNRTFLPFFDGASAYLRIDEEGKVLIRVGETDLGQGSNTVLAQIAAEELSISIDSVKVANVDTQDSPHGLGTFGDRVTTLSGNAVKDAALKAKEIILNTAAGMLSCDSDELMLENGDVVTKENPHKRIDFAEVAREASFDCVGGTVMVTGCFKPQDVSMVHPETKYGNVSCAYPFVAQIAEVEVNRKTGEVKVIYIAAAHDLGKVINPLLAEGQVHGAIAQGIGFALWEDLNIVNGKVSNDSFNKYRIAKTTDMPIIDTIFVESNDPQGPYGAKGLAEPALTPTAAAIANAVYDAVRVRIKELPITAEKILAGLHNN